jgi:hypothetical protein
VSAAQDIIAHAQSGKLVRFLQERYGIAAEDVYAHNWVDYKDSHYCEGCDLARARAKRGDRSRVPGAHL